MDNIIETQPQVNQLSNATNDHDVRIDQAYSYMLHAKRSGIVEKSPSEIKRLRRKIDWWIVPIMFCCYTMQFLDKVSLNVGSHRLIIRGGVQLTQAFSMQLSWG